MKKSKIVDNAIKILDYLISRDAMTGTDVRLQEIFDSLRIQEKEFNSADTFLLQQKYVEGTMGGMSGTRWLTGSGVEFYEKTGVISLDTQTNQGVCHMPDPKKVFVVHGRDSRLRDDLFSFLRALDLDPIEWTEALKLTGKATPYIGEAIESAFRTAQAVIVLLSPDDEVRLSPELWKDEDQENEKAFGLQARPNVLFEAGMAFGTYPDRTLLIEIGQIKPFSDVAGRHVVRLSNSPEKRNEIAERLRTAGCDVITSGNDWLKVGNFVITREITTESQGRTQPDLSEADIIAHLHSWWPRPDHAFPDDVKLNFIEVDNLLSLPPGSTRKYISQVASRKGFKPISFGDVVAVFEYDVNADDFGKYLEPA